MFSQTEAFRCPHFGNQFAHICIALCTRPVLPIPLCQSPATVRLQSLQTHPASPAIQPPTSPLPLSQRVPQPLQNESCKLWREPDSPTIHVLGILPGTGPRAQSLGHNLRLREPEHPFRSNRIDINVPHAGRTQRLGPRFCRLGVTPSCGSHEISSRSFPRKRHRAEAACSCQAFGVRPITTSINHSRAWELRRNLPARAVILTRKP